MSCLHIILDLMHVDSIKYISNKCSYLFYIDLLRCESLNSLDSLTCSRIMNKNYQLVQPRKIHMLRQLDNCFLWILHFYML